VTGNTAVILSGKSAGRRTIAKAIAELHASALHQTEGAVSRVVTHPQLPRFLREDATSCFTIGTPLRMTEGAA
jgi:hypothetical protein